MNYAGTLLTLFVPLLAGYLAVRFGLLQRGWSRRIQRTMMLILAPPVTFLAMWGLELFGIETLGVPLVGAVVCVAGMALGYPLARGLRLGRTSAGSFVVASGWSNTWLLGGYLCFILFGRQGLALAARRKI